MHRYVIVVLCFISVLAGPALGQKGSIDPIHVPAGTVLTFHLQTRLNPGARNEIDALPQGTTIQVRMLNAVDSDVDRDGSEFRGAIVSSVFSGNEVVVHANSEVHVLFALLRSRNHPEGFRYELLLTRVRDHGKSFYLTASLSPSFFEGTSHSETSGNSSEPSATGSKSQIVN